MSKHTPGPWQSVAASFIGTVEDDPQTIAYCSDHRNRKSRQSAEEQANAALIAAAPDLLAACVKFVASFKSLQREKCDVAHAMAKAAIEKAESR